jgi:L-alanine-DL-glutamate epimerase-like enolase superfamily enzyme
MKITRLECLPLSLPPKDRPSRILLVKIHTDEGITGFGDAGGVNDEAAVMMFKAWSRVLIGADPLDRSRIMSVLRKSLHSIYGVSYPAAVATIDFALWDLAGKALNQPVYNLLGGKAVEKLRYSVFVSSHGKLTTADMAKKAGEAVAGGVKSIGVKASGFGGGEPNRQLDLANLKAIRKVIGDDIELAIDFNASLDYWAAFQFGKQIEDLNLYKYEQPVAWYDIDGLANLRRNLEVPICSHESSMTVAGLMDVVKKDAVDILGTKLSPAGGLTEGVQWAKIAKATNLPMYCGAMNGPWEAAAQAHWLCSEPEFANQAHAVFFPVTMYGTYDTTQPTDIDLINNPMKYKEGYFWPPDGPGLGLELNEKAVPKYITPGKSIITIGEKERDAAPFFI